MLLIIQSHLISVSKATAIFQAQKKLDVTEQAKSGIYICICMLIYFYLHCTALHCTVYILSIECSLWLRGRGMTLCSHCNYSDPKFDKCFLNTIHKD